MLIEFYGTECPHCVRMKPLIDRLKQEEKMEIQQKETWHNSENEKEMEKYDQGKCGGVPFFINIETGAFLCGEVSYDELKNWAKGS